MKRKQKELIDCDNVAHTIVGASLSPVIRIDTLYSTCYYKYNENFIFKGERHDFWELVYVDNGNVVIESEQDRFTLFQSQFYLHAPNEFHTIRSASRLSNVFIFSFDSSSPALRKLLKTVIDATHKQSELLGSAFKHAQVILSPQPDSIERDILPYHIQLVKNYLELFLTYCFINETDKFIKKDKFGNALIESVTDYIEKNIGNKIDYAHLAKHTGYSISYVCKVFKKHMQKTILEYTTELRIEKAKLLISLNQYKMKEISEMLGFDSVQYFSYQFKKSTSMTPSQFAKSSLSRHLRNPSEYELINFKPE